MCTDSTAGDVFSVNMGHAEMMWCFDTKILRRMFMSSESKMSMLKGVLSRGIMVPLGTHAPFTLSVASIYPFRWARLVLAAFAAGCELKPSMGVAHIV